jgi:hypothetical protein
MNTCHHTWKSVNKHLNNVKKAVIRIIKYNIQFVYMTANMQGTLKHVRSTETCIQDGALKCGTDLNPYSVNHKFCRNSGRAHALSTLTKENVCDKVTVEA